jgi:hypothetical protein
MTLDQGAAGGIPPVRVPLEPVVGEVVPPVPRPSPLRFGLRTLFAVMVVCSAQFALMSYFGILAGVTAGLFLACAAFALVVVMGMAIPPRVTQRLRLDRCVVWLMMAMLVLFIGTMVTGGAVAVWEVVVQARNQAWLRTEVGLSVRPTWIEENGEWVQMQQIVVVFPGSAAAQAGLKSGDVILANEDEGDLGQWLSRNRGKDVDLTVATGSLNLVVKPTDKRTVTLAVPK